MNNVSFLIPCISLIAVVLLAAGKGRVESDIQETRNLDMRGSDADTASNMSAERRR